MDQNLLNELALRDGINSDLPFVFKTWLMGLRYGNDTFGFIEKGAYFDSYHKVIERILDGDKTLLRVACLQSDPKVILGYVVQEGERLHWIYTKPVWRKFGIAKMLMPKESTTVTHITKVGQAIMKEKYPSLIFNPFLK